MEVTATSLRFSSQEGRRPGGRAGDRSEQVTGLQMCAAVAPGNVEAATASAPPPPRHRWLQVLPGARVAPRGTEAQPRRPACWHQAPKDRLGVEGSLSDPVLQVWTADTRRGILPGLETAGSLCPGPVTESSLLHGNRRHVAESGYPKFQDTAPVICSDQACGKGPGFGIGQT